MEKEITQEIKDALKKFFWVDGKGKIGMSLRNHKLDFKKDYYFEKFTKKGVKLYWLNGTKKVLVIGKVEFNKSHGDYSFYTEGWNYMGRFNL